MSVDPLEVAHNIEKELTHLNSIRPSGACPSEVFFGCAGLDLTKDLLFAEEPARHPSIFSYEHGRGRPCVAH
jgi:hypothetical protein